MKYCLILISLLMSVFALANAQSVSRAGDDIYIAYPEVKDPDETAYYYQQVLRLILEKTRETHGDFQLHFSGDFYSLDRATHMLISGNNADVMWASVTSERDLLMQVIPFDLLRGLNNYRVLIIRPEDQKKFSKINTFAEFKNLTSGGGANWTSTKILKTHNINVSTAPYYESILKMLAAGRFDYISRGLHEATGDLKLCKTLLCDVAIESSILLQYQTPINYSFYVKKDNLLLADRLNKGLALANQDGSLLATFNEMTRFRDASQFMNGQRRIFVLDNNIPFHSGKMTD